MPAEHSAYIAVGSNLGDSPEYLRFALSSLRREAHCTVSALSPCYRSRAIGPGEQNDYLNAVIALRTALAPIALLELLQRIEQQAGRQRTLHWGPRTLDLDLLVYADLTLRDPRLTLPHPRLVERNFVVFPLHDLAPSLILPGGPALAEVRGQLESTGLARIDLPGWS